MIKKHFSSILAIQKIICKQTPPMNKTGIQNNDTDSRAQDEVVISLKGISKKYNLYDTNLDRLKESLHPLRKQYHRDFYALKDIDLEIKRGEVLGIVGKNGSGKSTLLKVISGILTPTSGSVEVKGNIVPLLELGAGFNPEYTGLENIYFYSALMGYTRNQIDAVLNDILEFAELGDFIYQPLKTYSSGMKARLAFAASVNVDPEILILDEVLSVGDIFFRAKCTLRMQEMIRSENTTVLFVSHDLNSIRSICDRSILLEGGKLVMDGDTQEVANAYFQKQVATRQNIIDNKKTDACLKAPEKKDYLINRDEFLKQASFGRIQNGKAEFINVQLLDENESVIRSVEYGQKVILRSVIEIHRDIEKLGCGYNIVDKNGMNIINSGSGIEDKFLVNIKKESRYVVDFRLKLEMMAGNYSITVAVSIPPEDPKIGSPVFCDFIPIAFNFTMAIRKPVRLYGLVHIDTEMDVKEIII